MQSELDENIKILAQALNLQCNQKWEESFEKLKKSWNILQKCISIADEQPQVQQILNQERQILPNFIMQNSEALMTNNSYQKNIVIKKEKKSRNIIHWSDQEVVKLEEALRFYKEPEFDKIAKYIGTRSKTQVRSKIQKLKLKLSKQNSQKAI